MEAQVAKLEANYEHMDKTMLEMKGDMAEIKGDLKWLIRTVNDQE